MVQREIKFRAWSDYYKRMFLWDELKEYSIEDVFNDADKNADFYGNLMQYTGLKDKHGNEIYEGDIVKVYNQAIRKVVFENSFWQMYEILDADVLGGFGTPTDSGHKPIYRYPEKDIEVIGNIHEHSHLLENENQ